jgi:putative transposase
VIKEMVTALEYRHVPTGTLAVLAQRLGKVWASALDLVSPGAHVRLAPASAARAPAQPKIGLRTTRANEMWHIDTTAYLHAVIDRLTRCTLVTATRFPQTSRRARPPRERPALR